jgi:hypothetical protein
MRRVIGLALLAVAPFAGAADGQLGLWVGRAFESRETDVARLTYRQALNGDSRAWWWPQHLQYGIGVWRVRDLGGITRRYDASVTPVWRREGSFGYIEGGIGVYLLSATINNETNRLPSALEFGSHLGAGLSFEKASVGLAVQHISNAGIKQPNGGINFYLLSVQVRL